MRFDEIINQQNSILKKIAEDNNIEFIDNEKLIDKRDELFLDHIHFSKEGMDKIAENFYKKIIEKNN